MYLTLFPHLPPSSFLPPSFPPSPPSLSPSLPPSLSSFLPSSLPPSPIHTPDPPTLSSTASLSGVTQAQTEVRDILSEGYSEDYWEPNSCLQDPLSSPHTEKTGQYTHHRGVGASWEEGLWSICLSWKYCHILSRQQRSKNLWGVLWNHSVVEIQHSLRWKVICTIGHFHVESTHAHYIIYHVVVPRVLHFSAFII